jgi:predicted permease
MPSIEGWTQDIRYAIRALRHSRRFTFWVVGSLALGMAVTIAALALLNASMILPFPHITDQHRLARISISRNCGRPDCWTRMSTPADLDALRGGLPSIDAVAAYTAGEVAAALPAARSMRALVTSANYFEVLGVRPAAGRFFDARDDTGDGAVAVIAHAAWLREFDGDPAVIGRSIRVADQFVHIIGVAPEHFIGTDRVRPGSRGPDLWLPMRLLERVLPFTPIEQRRQERDLAFVGRLKDGAGIARARSEAEVAAARLAAARGGGGQGARADVARVWRVRPESWHFGVITAMPIPLLVLLIACVNAANLMLARGSGRQRDIAIRLAIGAGRHRMIRQLLIESAMLAGLATAIAVPVSRWSLDLAGSPLDEPIPFDPLVLAATVLTALATTVAFGLIPAFRVTALQPSTALAPASGRSDAVPRQSRLRRALIVAQVALSLGVLATAWQLVSTVRAQAVSGGTPAAQLLIARFDLQPLKMSAHEVDQFYRDLASGAARLPGVEAVGLARYTSVWSFGQNAPPPLVVWTASDAPGQGRATAGGYAGADLFAAVGLKIVAGRAFTDADRAGRPRVAIVNESAARTLGGHAVGSTLRVARRSDDFNASLDVEVVGVIQPATEPRLEQGGPPPARIYLPSPIEPVPALALYLRTGGSASAAALPVRELVARIAPRVPVQEIGSLSDLNERSYTNQLWLARAAGVLGVIGLLLATAGLYGIASYVVAMRSREIAIRMAVGARPRTILSMILRQSMGVAGIGLVIGGTAAALVSRAIQSEYHGIKDLDGAAFGGAAGLFLAAMLIASVVPALRASRMDPVENLKEG